MIRVNENNTVPLLNYHQVPEKEITAKYENLKFLNNSTKVEILKRLNLAKAYIHENYHREISLNDIAQHACLSVNHLLRTFKLAYSKSPYQYLMEVRLERSQYLLKNTTYTIGEIATIIGFGSPGSFIRLFKRVYKVTPGRYRQRGGPAGGAFPSHT